uniref:AAA+ ATPase domain-containing protein n=1 Tax=viral metagenome TaxID=1070528 RepID=A0A6C0DSD4_9ZZZZ
MLKNDNIPFVEKYRPSKLDDVVLSPINRTIFKNILEKKYFPNLLFYGPPGTGKTSTIVNLINEYQKQTNQHNKGNVIHLNASDERGIDVIRNHIYQFIKSKNFFHNGLKFVILDEVDYMTKNAQQALKYLLQSSCYNVRFCLICNYISKIDESLKNEFICIRFNQLPSEDIYRFIRNISDKENLNISDNIINTIQENYQSDIRSMINFIQLNQNVVLMESNILTNDILEKIHTMLLNTNENEKSIINYLHETSIQYNSDKKNIIKKYLHYIICCYPQYITQDFLNMVEKIIHLNEFNTEHILLYFTYNLRKYYTNFSK